MRPDDRSGCILRLSSIFSEAVRNVASGTSKTAALVAALFAFCLTLGALDCVVTADILNAADKFRASGGATYVLSAQDSVDGAACERLSSTEGVVAAGAFRKSEEDYEIPALPSSGVSFIEVTPRFSELISVTTGSANADGLLLSDSVSSSLGALIAGDFLHTSDGPALITGTFSYPNDGRAPSLENAVLVPASNIGRFDECWMTVWPPDPSAARLLNAAIAASTAAETRVTVQQLNVRLGESFDGAVAFESRRTMKAPLAGLGFGALVGFLSIRSRRLELASARHCGVSVFDQLAHLLIETTAGCVLALSLTVSGLWIVALVIVPDHPGFAVAELVRIPLLGVVGAVAGSGMATLISRERHLFRYFKQRN